MVAIERVEECHGKWCKCARMTKLSQEFKSPKAGMKHKTKPCGPCMETSSRIVILTTSEPLNLGAKQGKPTTTRLPCTDSPKEQPTNNVQCRRQRKGANPMLHVLYRPLSILLSAQSLLACACFFKHLGKVVSNAMLLEPYESTLSAYISS
eukprot:1498060-Amphidinium_carterae.1